MVLLAGELEDGLLSDTGVIDPAGFDEQTVTDCHFRCLLGVLGGVFFSPAIGCQSQSHFRVVNPHVAGTGKPGERYQDSSYAVWTQKLIPSFDLELSCFGQICMRFLCKCKEIVHQAEQVKHE